MRSTKKKIEYKTKRLFNLTEDSLRRLVNVISSFYLSIGATKEELKGLLLYQIVCADNTIYTTDDLQDISDIENRGATRIIKMSIYSNSYSFRNPTGINYDVSFVAYNSPDKYGMVSADSYFSNLITVEGNDSENCERLMHSLKTYIENSIYTKKSLFASIFWYFQRPFVSAFLPMISGSVCGGAIILLWKQNVYSLRILILTILLAVSTILLIILNSRTDIIANRLPYIFNIGTNPENYSERIRKVKAIFGILSTIFIGIISTLLYEIFF